jgi:hypothetical protein
MSPSLDETYCFRHFELSYVLRIVRIRTSECIAQQVV